MHRYTRVNMNSLNGARLLQQDLSYQANHCQPIASSDSIQCKIGEESQNFRGSIYSFLQSKSRCCNLQLHYFLEKKAGEAGLSAYSQGHMAHIARLTVHARWSHCTTEMTTAKPSRPFPMCIDLRARVSDRELHGKRHRGINVFPPQLATVCHMHWKEIPTSPAT
jgi:hypothetical protein